MSPVQLVQQLSSSPSPLSAQQVSQLQALLSQLNPVQQAWVSGYLAASANSAPSQELAAATQNQAVPTLTILYGSQTGNAKGVAQQIKQVVESKGLKANLLNMADYKPKQLKSEQYLIVAVSTYGEGEPPEDAETLHRFIFSKKAPKLDNLNVAVIGLGDSSYEFFCKTAIDFDQRFKELGATTLFERAELDVDYEDEAQSWINNAVAKFEPELKQGQASSGEVIALSSYSATQVDKYNKNNPHLATVSAVQKITGRDSTKNIIHLELTLQDESIRYRPGDALGMYFINDKPSVLNLIEQVGCQADDIVTINEQEVSLFTALSEKLELTQSYPGFVEKYAEASNNNALKKLTEDKATLRSYLEPRQIFDIVAEHPASISAQQLVDCLRKQQARLYSIASSQAEVEDEVHLTIGLVEYQAFDEAHFGGCSGFVARQLAEDDEVAVYIEHNDNFRLPTDNNKPVIMIGPGTGIAPFRAFLQERDAREAEGKNWLFFGNPHFTQDFLYQTEIQAYVKSGLLTRVDLAFSRDQQDKIYVQDRLRQQGEEIFNWLEDGAHIYVCGDANHMAKDVHQALVDIISQYGNRDAEQAQQYLDELRTDKRYQKDVY